MKELIYLIVFYVFSTSFTLAQNDNLQLNKEEWKQQSESLKYGDATDEEEEEVPLSVDSDSINPNLDPYIWRPVFFSLLIIIALVVIIKIVKRSRAPVNIPRKRIEAMNIDEAEENLPEVALYNIYDDAIKANDFRSALRIKFLMVLQRLLDNNYIIWKKQKTNEQYMREISDPNIESSFSDLVLIFDEIWYGKLKISSELFEDISTTAENLIQRIDGQQE